MTSRGHHESFYDDCQEAPGRRGRRPRHGVLRKVLLLLLLLSAYTADRRQRAWRVLKSKQAKIAGPPKVFGGNPKPTATRSGFFILSQRFFHQQEAERGRDSDDRRD